MDHHPDTPPDLTPEALDAADQALLTALLEDRGSLLQLALAFELTPDQLLAWASSDRIKTKLAELKALADLRFEFVAAQAKVTAIRTLEQITAAAESPLERRRAASTILRALAPPPSPRGAAAPVPRPRPRRLPSSHFRPAAVVRAVLNALSQPDHPTPGCGQATLHAFLDDQARAEAPRPEDLAERLDADPGLTPLLGHTRVRIGEPHVSGHLARVEIEITPAPPEPATSDAPEPAPLPYTIRLTRPTTGPRRDCWLVRSIEPARQPAPDSG